MADSVIENLITRLSFRFDDDQLRRFDRFLETSIKGLAVLVAGATASSTAIAVFTNKIANANDALGKFSQRTGIDIEALQELGYVAELNGGSVDSMSSSLENLAKISSEAARGVGAGVEAFGMLGISVTDPQGRIKETDDLLLDVSDSISRLSSQSQKLEFAQKLGIGTDLLVSIQQGSKAIREQRKEARELGFVIGDDAAKSSAEFVDGMLRIKKILSGVANVIGTKLLRSMIPLLTAFKDWFIINKAIIKQNLVSFLDSAIKVVRGVWVVVFRVVNIIRDLVKAMGGWKNSIIIVTGLLVAMNASALLMPILAIAAGVGLALLLDEVATFARGGDSVLGQLLKKFPGLEDRLKKVLKLLKLSAKGWKLVFTHGDKALEGMLIMLKDVGEKIQTYLIDRLNIVINLLNKIPGMDVSLATEEGVNEKKSKAYSRMENAEGLIWGEIVLRLSKIIGLVGLSEYKKKAAPMRSLQQTATTNNSVINNNTTKPNIKIVINGGNKDEVKRSVTEVLTEQYIGANENVKSTVDF